MAAMGPMGAPLPDPSMLGAMPAGGQAPPDENAMILELLQALMSKWQGSEAQLAGEKSGLLQMLMMLVGVQPPGPADFAEPADPMMTDDVPGMV